MYSHIVIPVDGSEAAKRAAKHGLALADVFDATVDALHVVERDGIRLAEGADEKERLQEHGRRVLAEVEDIASEFDRPVGTELREGKPTERISAHAAERDADLLVLGRQGMTGLGRRLLGGVTENVLHRCDTPVFVVPDGAPVPGDGGYDRVLVPTDGSENAAAAAPHGATIARHYGSAVHVLNVVDLQAAGGMFDAGGLEAEFVDRLEAAGEDAVSRIEADIRETAPDSGVETAVVRTSGFEGVAAGIREYVDRNGIDVVVTGSHGRSNLRRQLLGSVASTVLRTVDVPVLVVQRPS